MEPKFILLTIEQAAERTQFCHNTIKKAMKDGELRFGKFGRLTRIKESDLEDWVERKIQATASGEPVVKTGVGSSSQGPSGANNSKIQVVEKIGSAR